MENKNTTTSSVSAKRHQTKELCVLEVQGKTEKLQCWLSNLSTTGAFFEVITTSNTPKKGDLVRVTVRLNELSKNYIIYGQVAWSRVGGIGVEFLKNTAKHRVVSTR